MRRQADTRVVQTTALCLLAFGAVMVFSASSATSLLGEIGDGAYYLKRTILFGAIGLILMRIVSLRSLKLIRGATPLFLLIAIGLLVATLMPGVGTRVNGAQSWIVAGPVQIQASELAKVALIMYAAHLLALRPNLTRSLADMRPILLIAAAVMALILVQPDLGTVMVSVFALAALLVAAGARLRDLALITVVIALIGMVGIMAEPYRMERVTGFLNPSADIEGAGFQTNQAQIALGSGGLLGVGLGESVQKAFYLPEAHTDMIAAVIGEELGLVGILMLVGLYLGFAYGALRVAQRARDRYGQLLVAGLAGAILVQATVNLFAVFGMMPLTGVTLPLVSYGNSSLIVTLISVGLILNVASGGTASGKGRSTGRAKLRVVNGGRAARSTRSAGRAATSTRRTGTNRAASSNRHGRDGRARRSGTRRRRRA